MEFTSFASRCCYLTHFITLHVWLLFSLMVLVTISANFNRQVEKRHRYGSSAAECTRMGYQRGFITGGSPAHWHYYPGSYKFQDMPPVNILETFLDKLKFWSEAMTVDGWTLPHDMLPNKPYTYVAAAKHWVDVKNKTKAYYLHKFKEECDIFIRGENVPKESFERAEIALVVCVMITVSVWLAAGWITLCVWQWRDVAYRVYYLCGGIFTALVVFFIILEIFAPYLFPPRDSTSVFSSVLVITLHAFGLIFGLLTFSTWKCRQSIGVNSNEAAPQDIRYSHLGA